MNRDDAQTIVDDIRALWELATPAADIARRLHLPLRIVRHIIETGKLPQNNSEPHWK